MKTIGSTVGRTVFIAAMALAALTAPVSADSVEDYSALRTAQTLDDLCRVLKFVERKAVDQVSWNHIRATTQYGFWQTGRWTDDDYSKWLAELDAAADAKANEIGCTQPAEAFLLKARGVASSEILQGLILAHHLAGLPEDDTFRRPMAPETIQATASYQAFLQQVYREQYPAFLEYNKQQAAARLPGNGMPVCSFLTPPDVPCYETFGGYMDDDYYKRMGEVGAAAYVVNDVQFEVAAETAGYRVAFGLVQKAYIAAHVMEPRDWSLVATVVDNTRIQKLDGGGEVFGLMAERNGLLRFMTYGAEAEKLRTGAVRLLVRTEPKPDNLADWEIFNLTDFRSLTFPFDGVLLEDKCLGGPCFEFSAEASAAMLQMGFDEKAELWLSASADAAPSATADWVHRNPFYPQLFFRMQGKEPPTAK